METTNSPHIALSKTLVPIFEKALLDSPLYGALTLRAEICAGKLARFIVSREESNKIQKNEIGGEQ